MADVAAKLSNIDVICDESYNSLTELPKKILQMENLKMLYLDGNSISCLPNDFFQKLSKLYWLDLRGNKLTEIPAGIAFHNHLENLLLQNNNIDRLPNEVGLVPSLKVLQVSGNPLFYPPDEIIRKGTNDICNFLKQNYYKDIPLEKESVTQTEEISPKESEKSSKRLQIENVSNVNVTVTGLGKRISELREQQLSTMCPKLKRSHKVIKSPSKISIHSVCNSDKYVGVMPGKSQEQRIQEQNLKEVWLEKLRTLIKDQQKIIEQETSLSALKSWRKEKKSTKAAPPSPVPYDTEMEYNKLMSRDDQTATIEKLIAAKRRSSQTEKVNVDKMISDVVSQLKGMEVKLKGNVSASEKLLNAEREIQMIVDLHKRIADIQAENDQSLQN